MTIEQIKQQLEKDLSLDSGLKSAGLDEDIRHLYVDGVARFCWELIQCNKTVISTKYQIGDTVYFMHKNSPTKLPIKSITVFTNGGYTKRTYSLGDATPDQYEHELFSSKEELRNHLIKILE